MTRGTGRRRLDPQGRAAALAAARRPAQARPVTPAGPERGEQAEARPIPGPTGEETLSRPRGLASLDSWRQLQTLLQASEALGLASPYFRLHEGHATEITRIDGRECLNFASYDYLGLNADPRPRTAAHEALDRHGVSASGSRLVSGSRPVHLALEAALAAHYGAEEALCFVSGHATNVSLIDTLTGEKDLVLADAYIHNSVTTGMALTRAARRSFPHNDLDALERILRNARPLHRHVLIVVEGLYSMDGDIPDLPRLLALRDRYDAWLMVDEAHALGPVGATGQGVFEHFGIDPAEVDIWMGTLSKSLAATGGYVAGSAALIRLLAYGAAGHVYSVALPPALAASATEALRIMAEEPWRARKLQENGRHFIDRARELGFRTGPAAGCGVLPVILGDSALAVKLSERMLGRGINVAPVTFPGVPMQAARLRFFLSADHDTAQIDTALAVLAEERDRLDAEGFTRRLGGTRPDGEEA